MPTDGATQQGPLRSKRRGEVVHELVWRLAADGLRHNDVEMIRQATRAHRYCTYPHEPNTRMAAVASVCVPACVYFGRNTPGTDWTFLAGHYVEAHTEFDLVWRLPDGRIVVDELKVERLSLDSKVALRGQTTRQLTAAHEVWGETFGGLRMCVLTDRYASYDVLPDGTRHPAGTIT